MDGRDHTGVLWCSIAGGDPATEVRSRWCSEERLAAWRGLPDVGAAVRLRPSAGFELPAGGSHAVLVETVSDDLLAVAGALGPLGEGGAVEELLAYRLLSRTGGSTGRRTRGIVAVFTDCADPAAEDDFNDWYALHAREVVKHLGHHAVTRYRSAGPADVFARYLAVYETESPDPGKVQRDGMAWYFESGHVDEFPTPQSLIPRAEVALERDL